MYDVSGVRLATERGRFDFYFVLEPHNQSSTFRNLYSRLLSFDYISRLPSLTGLKSQRLLARTGSAMPLASLSPSEAMEPDIALSIGFHQQLKRVSGITALQYKRP